MFMATRHSTLAMYCHNSLAMLNQDRPPFRGPQPKFIKCEAPTHFTTFDGAMPSIEEALMGSCSFLQLMGIRRPDIELEISKEEIRQLTKQYELVDELFAKYLSRFSIKLDEQQ